MTLEQAEQKALDLYQEEQEAKRQRESFGKAQKFSKLLLNYAGIEIPPEQCQDGFFLGKDYRIRLCWDADTYAYSITAESVDAFNLVTKEITCVLDFGEFLSKVRK
jgi:hypothetical protein